MTDMIIGAFIMALGVVLGVWVQHRKQNYQAPFVFIKPEEPDEPETYKNEEHYL